MNSWLIVREKSFSINYQVQLGLAGISPIFFCLIGQKQKVYVCLYYTYCSCSFHKNKMLSN